MELCLRNGGYIHKQSFFSHSLFFLQNIDPTSHIFDYRLEKPYSYAFTLSTTTKVPDTNMSGTVICHSIGYKLQRNPLEVRWRLYCRIKNICKVTALLPKSIIGITPRPKFICSIAAVRFQCHISFLKSFLSLKTACISPVSPSHGNIRLVVHFLK